MNELMLIDDFTRNWRYSPQDVVREGVLASGNRMFELLTEIERLQVALRLFLGIRGGVTEELIAVDPSQRITIDQLVLAVRSVSNDGLLVDRQALRAEIGRSKDPAEVCRRHMQDLLALIKDKPEWFAGTIRNLALEDRHSLRTVSGGLPSLGKRR